MIKASQLREQTADEIRQLCRETRRQLQELRAKRGIGEGLDKPVRLRILRRELARIATVMQEKGIGENG